MSSTENTNISNSDYCESKNENTEQNIVVEEVCVKINTGTVESDSRTRTKRNVVQAPSNNIGIKY